MGGFVHLELNTGNLKKAKSFYTKLFGWQATDMQMPTGPYTMLSLQGPGGAMQKKPGADAPSMWLPYIEVDDVKQIVQAAEKAGATATLPHFAVEGMGEGAILTDPTGAPFGIWHTFAHAAPTNGAAEAAAAPRAGKKRAGKKKATKKKKVAKKKAAVKKAPAKKAGKKSKRKAKK